MKKLLFIGEYPNSADPYVRIFFRNLIYAIADLDYECTVIAPVSLTRYRRKGLCIPFVQKEETPHHKIVTVYRPKILTFSAKKIFRWNTRRLTERCFQNAALRTAKKTKKFFDAVYGHFFLDGGLAAVKIGRKLHIPSFIAFGECDFESQVRSSYGDIKPKEISGLTGIISVSTDNCRELKTMPTFDNIPILLAPNSVDTSKFYVMEKSACRKQFGISEDIFVVGFVGGFIERKGDKRLLAAINQLKDVYVAFAGKGEKPEGEKVVFCNSLDHDTIPAFLNAVDIFALPTLSEGCCNAIVEAMACGLPIISSNLPFNEDILNDCNSIKINPMSIEEIRDSIKKLSDNNNLREKLSLGALQTAKQLTIENRAKKITEFIYSFCNKR